MSHYFAVVVAVALKRWILFYILIIYVRFYWTSFFIKQNKYLLSYQNGNDFRNKNKTLALSWKTNHLDDDRDNISTQS